MKSTVTELDGLNLRIIKTIREHQRIRWRPLMKIITSSSNSSEKSLMNLAPEVYCSERIFRERLNHLVENRLVFREEIKNGYVEYIVDKDLLKTDQTLGESFDNNYSEIEFVLNNIEKNKTKIPIDDLAGQIHYLWQIINHLELRVIIFSVMTNNQKLVEKYNWKKLRIKLLGLVDLKSNIERIQLLDLIDKMITYETTQRCEVLKQDLTAKNIPWHDSKTS